MQREEVGVENRKEGDGLSAHDVISRHVVAVVQWPGRLITSCCSSGLTQHL